MSSQDEHNTGLLTVNGAKMNRSPIKSEEQEQMSSKEDEHRMNSEQNKDANKTAKMKHSKDETQTANEQQR